MDDRLKLVSLWLMCAALAGCHHSPPAPSDSSANSPVHIRAQFILSGAVDHPGPRPLLPGETISEAVSDAIGKSSNPTGMTVVLIRRGPDGKTRELINVGPTGHVIEPKQDYALRDGDELMLPSPSTLPSDLPMQEHRP